MKALLISPVVFATALLACVPVVANGQTHQDPNGYWVVNDAIWGTSETWLYLGQAALGSQANTGSNFHATGTVQDELGTQYSYILDANITPAGNSPFLNAPAGNPTTGGGGTGFYELSYTLIWDKPVPVNSFRAYLAGDIAGGSEGAYGGAIPQPEFTATLGGGTADFNDFDLRFLQTGVTPNNGDPTPNESFIFTNSGSSIHNVFADIGTVDYQQTIWGRGANSETFTSLAGAISGVAPGDSIGVRFFTTFTPVPEPSSMLLAVLTGSLAFMRRRRGA